MAALNLIFRSNRGPGGDMVGKVNCLAILIVSRATSPVWRHRAGSIVYFFTAGDNTGSSKKVTLMASSLLEQ